MVPELSWFDMGENGVLSWKVWSGSVYDRRRFNIGLGQCLMQNSSSSTWPTNVCLAACSMPSNQSVRHRLSCVQVQQGA
jgi:hypothetical protein